MSDTIQSIARASAILEAIAAHENHLSITELSGIVDLHKSTVHRILSTLITLGYVKQNEMNNHYELTVKLFELGSSVVKNNDLVTVARPYLEHLGDVSNEVVHLVIPDGDEIIYIDKVESNQTLRMHSYVGRRAPMYCTAVGKAILSEASEQQVKAYWSGIHPIKHTQHTLTTLPEFIKALNQIKKTGISYDNEEHETDIRCIATTLHNYAGHVIGAISISGPIQRMNDDHINELIPELLEVKENISKELGRL